MSGQCFRCQKYGYGQAYCKMVLDALNAEKANTNEEPAKGCFLVIIENASMITFPGRCHLEQDTFNQMWQEYIKIFQQ